MKEEKSLNFLCSKWLMVTFLALGILLFSSVDAVAQAQNEWSDAITYMTNIRDGFAPGTAKYDIADQAVDYFITMETNVSNDPNYLNNLQDLTGADPYNAAPVRRAHKSILADYTIVQLASFSNYVAEFNAGNITDAAGAEKRQWILDANSY